MAVIDQVIEREPEAQKTALVQGGGLKVETQAYLTPSSMLLPQSKASPPGFERVPLPSRSHPQRCGFHPKEEAMDLNPDLYLAGEQYRWPLELVIVL